MAEERPTYETLLDCFLYAPLGAALVFVDEAPRLAERGRERVVERVTVARVVGRIAVEEANRRLRALSPGPSREQSWRSQESAGPASHTQNSTVSATTSAKASGSPRTGNHDVRAEPSSCDAAETRSCLASSRATDVTGRALAIPAYDTLAASQVVERLASLTPGELEAVREHESATRRRRTVLHRIAQLNAERDGATA